MTDLTPNEEQQALIDGIDGTYLVDAGAGTGKTFALTERYGTILEDTDADPADVLLVTFTRSAAREMKDRIVSDSPYAMRDLADAPIQTFHSYCNDLLTEFGTRAPHHIGIAERITSSTEIVSDEILADMYFSEWYGRFKESHPEHADFFRIVDSSAELHGLVDELAAKGVFPTATGWYRDGKSILHGEWEAFEAIFSRENTPRNDGRSQSPMRQKLNSYGKEKRYVPDAPTKQELRGEGGTKQIDPAWAERVFESDRDDLIAFIHDVYFSYLRFAIRRNYLSFGFLQLFALVLLIEEDDVREQAAFEYVMVDEFQDSSEIQFKLSLLLTKGDNLCVVGDWKQSIYSFQFADVDNIREFEDRINRYAESLNRDADRVAVDPHHVTSIAFVQNYRSTQSILDFSEHALLTPATRNENVDESIGEAIVSLASNVQEPSTNIHAYQHENEIELVLSTIQDIVGNTAYAIPDGSGTLREPQFEDIAVFSRTRAFCRSLWETARSEDVPLTYDGGSEIFRTDAAKLVLAWLRILDADADRGWAVVLNEAGASLDEVRTALESAAYPEAMCAFRETLREYSTIDGTVQAILDKYGIDTDAAAVLVQTIRRLHEQTTLGMGGIVQYIERGIQRGATKDVSEVAGSDAVTVQTIHAAKGLEYPIVILANMNEHVFPSRGGNSPVIQFRDPIGIRQRKMYGHHHKYPHIYDNWRYDVLRHCVTGNNDEERRLLYVALTRAQSHLLMTAGESPNAFIEQLPVELRSRDPSFEEPVPSRRAGETLSISTPPKEEHLLWNPHTLMDDSVFATAEELTQRAPDDAEIEYGKEVGSSVHEFAEAYIGGDAPEPEDVHSRTLVDFLASLSGTKSAEVPVSLPIDLPHANLTIRGRVDLVHETEDAVEVIDYKTDRTRGRESEYRKQLSVYYHVVAAHFAPKPVRPLLFYTATGERVSIDPLSKADLQAVAEEAYRESNEYSY